MIALGMLAGLGAGAWWGIHKVGNVFGGAADYSGSGTGSVTIRVNKGDSAAAIGRTLEAQGVVKSAAAFVDAARGDDRSRGITPGTYDLRRHMSGSAALKLILDPSSRVSIAVTIPEGYTVDEVLQRFADKTKISLADLKAAAKNPAALGLPSWAHGHLEGFLFPATYDVEPGDTAKTVLSAMVDRFGQAAQDVNLQKGAAALGVSAYDIVTVASLIEREARIPEDFGKVSRVVYNRLKLGMPLQFDSTVNYALGKSKTNVTIKDTKVDSAYNTYQHKGLPPTPIASPGEKTLQAALNPTPGDWLYFVTMDDAGHNAFAATHEEFLKLKAKAEKQRSQ